MSLTQGSLWLFKFVPDEFVAALPPSCNSNYLGYILFYFPVRPGIARAKRKF
jgi:hypothetical protein